MGIRDQILASIKKVTLICYLHGLHLSQLHFQHCMLIFCMPFHLFFLTHYGYHFHLVTSAVWRLYCRLVFLLFCWNCVREFSRYLFPSISKNVAIQEKLGTFWQFCSPSVKVCPSFIKKFWLKFKKTCRQSHGQGYRNASCGGCIPCLHFYLKFQDGTLNLQFFFFECHCSILLSC